MVMRIVDGSGGSFLCPPGHPMHLFHIEDGSRKNPNLIAGLDYALEHGDPKLRASVEALHAKHRPVMSPDWVLMVYGYFHNCYSPDGVDRDASNCVIPKKGDPVPPPEHHLGYLTVKSYFPEATPRLDLIADASGGYGQWPCAKCGTALQYEASVDAWATPIEAGLACPKGGHHEKKTP